MSFDTTTDFMPVTFHFKVSIGVMMIDVDSSFREVSGLETKLELQPVKEGGENRFQHQLPTGVKQQNLSLKRGIAGVESPLVAWCKAIMEGGLSMEIVPSPVWISLLDPDREPTRMWLVHRAFPVRWNIDAFNSTKNEVAIETIELAYQYVERIL